MASRAWITSSDGVMLFAPTEHVEPVQSAKPAYLLQLLDDEGDYVDVARDDLNNHREDATLQQDGLNYHQEDSSLYQDNSDIHREDSDLDFLPRLTEELALHIKDEPAHETAADSITPLDTPSTASGHHFDSTPSPAAPSSSSSYQDECIFDQLRIAAESSAYCSPTSSSHLTTSSSLTSVVITDSDSESSPCLRGKRSAAHVTVTQSRFFSNRRIRKRSIAIKRPSWNQTLGNERNSRSSTQGTKTENALSLEFLANLKDKRHDWTTNDRITLLSLRRWYIMGKNDFKDLFNSLTGLKMKHGTLTTQFACNSSPFDKVRRPFYSVAFDDPEHVYQNIRAYIESRAAELGIEIHRRTEPETNQYEQEGLWESGWTISSAPAESSSPAQNHGHCTRLGGYAIADANRADDADEFIDVEVAPTPSSSASSQDSPRASATTCHLAFRVWDANSRTTFREDYGFIADLFAHRRAPVPEPLSREDPMFDVLANAHLSIKGNTSSFVSTASSLLQALNYANSMDNPRIAVINLQHLELNTPSKKHAAREIIKDLQSKGEMWWTRYKAAAEHIIWGDLPQSTIMHTFHLSELVNLVTDSANVAALLNLNVFNTPSRTRSIASHLRKKGLALDTDTANAMGKVARLFGLAGPTVTTSHITEFVTYLVDGWSIRADQRQDIHTMADLAAHFAIILGTQHSSMRLQDVIAAFMEGFERGTQNLAHFSHRRRTA